MIWPWAERAGAVTIKLEKPLPIEEKHLPKLRAWRKAMRKDSVVDEIYHSPEQFWKTVLFKLKKASPDYDGIA